LVVASSAVASVKVASYNIRNFDTKKSPTDKKELKKILVKLNADFITVEEIVNTNSFKKFIKAELPEYGVTLAHCGGGGRQKIGFLYNKIKFSLLNITEDNRVSDPANVVSELGCGRLRPALVGVFLNNKTNEQFVVVGLHLKAGGNQRSFDKRWKQYKIVAKIVKELKANYKNIILMGDLNTTGYSVTNADYDKFEDLLTETKMQTIATEFLCTSYWAGLNRQDNIEESSILDHIIYPNNFLGYKAGKVEVHSHCKKSKCANVTSSDLGSSYKNVSDHCPISITFK
jgi:endonuclease/exonuclease/phosphatase family metal-dependent hydrolase